MAQVIMLHNELLNNSYKIIEVWHEIISQNSTAAPLKLRNE